MIAVIVLPRRGGDVSRTLESLARQERVPHRVFVVQGAGGAPAGGSTPAIADDPEALGSHARDCEFVAFVRAGDVVLSDALGDAASALDAGRGAVMTHALWIPLGAGGRVQRGTARSHLARLRAAYYPGEGPGQAVAAGLQALPVFRTEWLLAPGAFRGNSMSDATERAAMAAVRESRALLLDSTACAVPAPGQPRIPPRRAAARVRYRAGRVLSRARDIAGVLARQRPASSVLNAARRLPSPWAMFGSLLRRFSFNSLRTGSRQADGRERVAYVLWQYPTLSETFIRREVEGLRSAGLSLQVFALEPGEHVAGGAAPGEGVTYFGPEEPRSGRAFIFRRFRHSPLVVARLALYVVRSRSVSGSTWRRDRDVLYLAGQLAAALRRERVTLVHSPWANPYALVAFVASRLLGVPFTVQARASEIHRTAQARDVSARLRFADYVVTNSRYNQEYLAGLCGPGGPPVHVIYNGLDLHRFPSPFREREPGPLSVLAVGRLVEPKGFRYLLQACRLLVERGLIVDCEIIGGPVVPSDTVTWVELRKLQSDLGLSRIVRLGGARSLPEVLEAMRRADAFVLPCVRARDGSHDITPNSLIEAMAMELPVVSTFSGAIPEIVDDGVNGLLVPPGDVAALVGAIERLAGDESFRRRLGEAARRKVEQRFDITRNTADRLALLRSSGAPAS